MPAGPIAGPGFKTSGTWGYSYTPVTGTDVDDERQAPETVTLNGGTYLAAVGPMHTSVRASLASYLDVGYDFSMLDNAVQLRGGPLDANRAFPFGVQLEYRWGQFTKYHDFDDTRIVSARLEAYPHLADRTVLRSYLVTSLGVSLGNQLFSVAEMPERFHYDMEDRLGGPVNGPEVEFRRKEMRLEAFLGAHFRLDPGILTVVLAPHVVIFRPDPVDPLCDGCGTYFSANATHDWGISLLISPGISWEKDGRKRKDDGGAAPELW